MAQDLQTLMVDGVIARDDEADEAVKQAGTVDMRSMLRQVVGQPNGDDMLVRLMIEATLKASVKRLPQQAALAVQQAKEEGVALRNTDARTLKAITDIDVAERRAAKLMEGKPN